MLWKPVQLVRTSSNSKYICKYLYMEADYGSLRDGARPHAAVAEKSQRGSIRAGTLVP
jgi:hypothetical protein